MCVCVWGGGVDHLTLKYPRSCYRPSSAWPYNYACNLILAIGSLGTRLERNDTALNKEAHLNYFEKIVTL